MSNKPKIYAYCSAGCKWETIHKSDVPAKYIYLTKEEYDKLTEYEDDVMYFVYDEGYVFTEADHAKNADTASNAQRANNAVEVSERIKGLPITDIFQYFDEESGELTSGFVKNAINSTYADFTDFSNNNWSEDIEFNADTVINTLKVNKTYHIQLISGSEGINIHYYDLGLVYIPESVAIDTSLNVSFNQIGSIGYTLSFDISTENVISLTLYKDGAIYNDHGYKLRFKEIR